MKAQKILPLLLLIVVSAIGVFALFLYKQSTQDVHYHAGFTVYIENVKQDYSSALYMNFTPCNEHSSTESEAEEQIEKAHLHDGNGDVVHVHRNGGLWKDLFSNINVVFDSSKEIEGYSSAGKISNILNTKIKANQSIIIVVGDQSKAADYQKDLVTLERIKEVEAKSELCGKK